MREVVLDDGELPGLMMSECARVEQLGDQLGIGACLARFGQVGMKAMAISSMSASFTSTSARQYAVAVAQLRESW